MFWLETEITAAQWRAARAAVKLTMRQLAAMAGTSTDTLVKLEKGGLVHKSVTKPIKEVLNQKGIEFLPNGIEIAE